MHCTYIRSLSLYSTLWFYLRNLKIFVSSSSRWVRCSMRLHLGFLDGSCLRFLVKQGLLMTSEARYNPPAGGRLKLVLHLFSLFFSQIKMSEMPMYGTSAKKEYVQEFGRFKHVSRSFQVVSSYSIHEDDFLIPKRGKVVPGAPWFWQRSIGVVPCTYIYIYIHTYIYPMIFWWISFSHMDIIPMLQYLQTFSLVHYTFKTTHHR